MLNKEEIDAILAHAIADAVESKGSSEFMIKGEWLKDSDEDFYEYMESKFDMIASEGCRIVTLCEAGHEPMMVVMHKDYKEVIPPYREIDFQ